MEDLLRICGVWFLGHDHDLSWELFGEEMNEKCGKVAQKQKLCGKNPHKENNGRRFGLLFCSGMRERYRKRF
jgi:hypothetical protein